MAKGNTMKLWEMTLEDFLTDDLQITGSPNTTLESFLPLLKEGGWYEGKEELIEGSTEFATAPAKRIGQTTRADGSDA